MRSVAFFIYQLLDIQLRSADDTLVVLGDRIAIVIGADAQQLVRQTGVVQLDHDVHRVEAAGRQLGQLEALDRWPKSMYTFAHNLFLKTRFFNYRGELGKKQCIWWKLGWCVTWTSSSHRFDEV